MSENIQDRPIAVQVTGVKKMYKLGQIGGGSLQKDLQSWWARKRGKEDPNSIIGAGERSHGDTFMALNGVDLTIYQGEAVGIISGRSSRNYRQQRCGKKHIVKAPIKSYGSYRGRY